MKQLTAITYLNAFKSYGVKITGGTIHDFLRASTVTYYGGKCPVYYVEYWCNGTRVVVGGNYAAHGKPQLTPSEEIDF